jgi:YVTN family beta-propeller protein
MVKRLSLLAAIGSIILLASCGMPPPAIPGEPTGPSSGDVGVSYGFTAVTTDPQNLPLAYQFEWGNGAPGEWSRYVASGEPVTMQHAWSTGGAYRVRVRARDIAGKQCEWSPAHLVLIGSQQSGYPDTVVANISIGGDPTDIAVLPNGRYAYVANQIVQYVTVVDVENRNVVAHVTCGSNPYMCAAMPNGEYVYVTSEWDDEISVIRTSDNTVVDKVKTGACPHRLCFSPDGSRCYTANQNDNTVSVIGTVTRTVIATIPVGNIPRDVDCNADYIFTANVGSTNLTKIRASDNTVVATIELGFTPHRVRVMPGGEYVYATEYWGDRIAVVRISDNTLVATIKGSGAVCGMCFVNDGEYLFVASGGYAGGYVLVVRTSDNTIVDHINTGSGAMAVRTPADGAYVACSNRNAQSITIIGRH